MLSWFKKKDRKTLILEKTPKPFNLIIHKYDTYFEGQLRNNLCDNKVEWIVHTHIKNDLIATLSVDGRLKVWKDKLIYSFSNCRRGISSCVLLSDTEVCIPGEYGGFEIHNFIENNIRTINNIHLNNIIYVNKTFIGTAYNDIVISDLFTLKAHDDYILYLIRISDTQIASRCLHGIIKIWNILTGKLELQLIGQRTSHYAYLGFSNNFLVSSGLRLEIWNLKTTMCTYVNIDTSSISCIILNYQEIIIGFRSGKIEIWDLNGHFISSFKAHKTCISNLIVLFDGRLASCSYEENKIKIWRQNKCVKVIKDEYISGLLNNGNLVTRLNIWN